MYDINICNCLISLKVLSASGVVLGKHTVRVVTDRVVVEELKTQLISSIQVEYVGIEHELSSDTIVIRMKPESKLTKRYQVCSGHKLAVLFVF